MEEPSIWEGVGIALLVSSPVFLVVGIYWVGYCDIVGTIREKIKSYVGSWV